MEETAQVRYVVDADGAVYLRADDLCDAIRRANGTAKNKAVVKAGDIIIEWIDGLRKGASRNLGEEE